MKYRPICRRSFLRLAVISAAGAISTACGRAFPKPDTSKPMDTPIGTQVPQVTVTSTPTPVEATDSIWIEGSDQEVWSWKKQVGGKVINAENCLGISVHVNGREVQTTRGGEDYSAQLLLDEGDNRIFAVCTLADGREIRSNMLTYRERLKRGPKAVIRPSLAGDRLVLDGTQSQPSESTGAAIVDHVWSARPENPARALLQSPDGKSEREFIGEVSGDHITLAIPVTDGEYYFNLQVLDQNGRGDGSSIYVEVKDGALRIPDYDRENPFWVDEAVVYGVIPRNFGSPGFKAIVEKLDYLKDLGITALWLAPVNVSPKGDYGYAIVDYFDLNPAYGTKEDFHRMVQEAHARDIRVLMDFVPNHSSVEHPYYQDTLKNGDKSPYWDYYDRDENGSVTHYFDWTHLPNLNYDNPEVRRWMLEAFSYWVRDFDVDGFRVDVAWGIKQRRPDFWPEWRRELKRIKPDLLLLAEAGARDPFYVDNGFDAAYDWTDQLGHWAWELVWDSYKNRLLSYNLHAALTNRPDGFHPDSLIFRFLNNNDTGDRFITRFGEGMARVATALLLTLPGLPCIYTGDEIGAEFHPYKDSAPISWDEKYPGLLDYHKRLIALRKEIPSLHSRLWEAMEIKPIPQEVYGYIRYLEPAESPVLVLLNFFEEPAEIDFTLPERFRSLADQGFLVDLLADETFPLNGPESLRIPVPGLTARILTRKS